MAIQIISIRRCVACDVQITNDRTAVKVGPLDNEGHFIVSAAICEACLRQALAVIEDANK